MATSKEKMESQKGGMKTPPVVSPQDRRVFHISPFVVYCDSSLGFSNRVVFSLFGTCTVAENDLLRRPVIYLCCEIPVCE